MLPHPEVEVAPPVGCGSQVAGAVKGQPGLGRGGQIGCTPNQPGNIFRYCIEHPAGTVPAGQPLRVGGEDRHVLIPTIGQLAVLHPVQLIGQLRVLLLVRLKLGEPGLAQRRTPRPDTGLKMFAHSVGDQELGLLRPAVGSLGQPNFLLTQRLAVGGAGTLFGRRAVGNMAIDDNQGGPG